MIKDDVVPFARSGQKEAPQSLRRDTIKLINDEDKFLIFEKICERLKEFEHRNVVG